MATILERSDLNNTDPQIHVLSIGVGDYPHVVSNSGNPDCPPFSNLISPPTSALRLCKWLRDNEALMAMPVGSIELVTSPSILMDVGNGPIASSDATLDSIMDAFNRWYERCDWSKDNIAVFYFCGHGLSVGLETLLLPNDFFQSLHSPFAKCIRLDSTMMGMLKNRANCQLFLIDCCRSQPSGFQPAFQSTPGVPLKELRLSDHPIQSKCSTAIFAAQFGLEAFGPATASPTPFVELLIDGLANGTCAQRGPLDWFVSPMSLANKSKQLAEYRQSLSNSAFPTRTDVRHAPLFDNTFDRPFRALASPPPVATKIFVMNPVPSSSASLVVSQRGGTIATLGRSAWPNNQIDLSLPAGSIDVSIVDPPGPERLVNDVFVEPVKATVWVS